MYVYLTFIQIEGGFYYEPYVELRESSIPIFIQETVSKKDGLWIVYHMDTGCIYKVCKYKKNNRNLKIPPNHIGYTTLLN